MSEEAQWLTADVGAAGYRTEIRSGRHNLIADEPSTVGGSDEGPTPYDLLLGAIASCTAITLRMYADRKGWPLEGVTVRMRSSRSHAADCADCETKPVGLRRLDRAIELRGPLDAEQRERLLRVADRCPVKQTLEGSIEIVPVE